MKILEFADLDTSRVKPAYRKVVAAIASGDFRAAQVRKLAGAGHGKLYRARLNDADRLIFCLLRHDDDICALMLEVIVNHDYEKSRFLRGAVIDEDKIVDCAAAEAEREAQSLRYLNPERTIVHLLVAGFSIAAKSMASHCNTAICGDIDRGEQNSNCFEGRNDEKPEMAMDSDEFEFRAVPAICLTASEHRQPGPGAETALA